MKHGVRRQALLSFIAGYITKNGWAPSIREMCDGTGLSSTSSVAYQLDVLEDLGYIERSRRNSRALRVTKQGSLVAGRSS